MSTSVSHPEVRKQDDSGPGSRIEKRDASGREEITLFELLLVLAERWRIVLAVAACVTVLSAIVSLILPQSFTATVTLLPPQQASSLSAALTSQIGNLGGAAALVGGGLGIKNPNEMYVAMFKSRGVEDAMVQHFGLMAEYRKRYLSDARKAFEKHTTVEAGSKDGLIHISVEDRDPNRAAELANGFVDQFRELSKNLAITEAAQRRLFFERQLVEAKDKLASSEEALKQTEQATGFIQLDSQSRALIESAASLRAGIAAREVAIQGMQTYATGENPQLLQAQKELDSMRAQLAKLGGSDDSSSAGFLVPKGKVPSAGLEYIRRYRDVKYNETVFEILARQFEIAKLDEAKQGALVQVVDAATPPDRRSFPKRTLIVIGAAFVGLVIGIITAIVQAGLERARNDPSAALKLHMLRQAFFRRTREVI